MLESDMPEFALLLDSVSALLTRGQYTPNDTATAIFFNALAEHPMPAVRKAFERHVRASKFCPTPADLLDYLQGSGADDGRPGAEEAWSIALGARDEADTVVWTPEIARAWDCAAVVLRLGDEVGARMVFREAYNRDVERVRQSHAPVRWVLCEGHDPARRADAVRLSIARGRSVEGADDLLALPAPGDVPVGLATAAAGNPSFAALGLAKLLELRDRMVGPRPYVPGPDVAAREFTDGRRAETAAAVQAFASEHGIDLTPPPGAPRPVPAVAASKHGLCE